MRSARRSPLSRPLATCDAVRTSVVGDRQSIVRPPGYGRVWRRIVVRPSHHVGRIAGRQSLCAVHPGETFSRRPPSRLGPSRSPHSDGRLRRSRRQAPPVFRHGVASGDPLADRVLLWTRVTTSRAESAEVSWTVAPIQRCLGSSRAAKGERGSLATSRSRSMSRVCPLPPCITTASSPRAGNSRLGGRARCHGDGIAPSPWRGLLLQFSLRLLQRLRGPRRSRRPRCGRPSGRLPLRVSQRQLRRRHGTRPGSCADHEIVALGDYRQRHAQYKTDPDSQEVHRQHPFIVVWDDHELTNNAWWGGAENHDPDPTKATGMSGATPRSGRFSSGCRFAKTRRRSARGSIAR